MRNFLGNWYFLLFASPPKTSVADERAYGDGSARSRWAGEASALETR